MSDPDAKKPSRTKPAKAKPAKAKPTKAKPTKVKSTKAKPTKAKSATAKPAPSASQPLPPADVPCPPPPDDLPPGGARDALREIVRALGPRDLPARDGCRGVALERLLRARYAELAAGFPPIGALRFEGGAPAALRLHPYALEHAPAWLAALPDLRALEIGGVDAEVVSVLRGLPLAQLEDLSLQVDDVASLPALLDPALLPAVRRLHLSSDASVSDLARAVAASGLTIEQLVLDGRGLDDATARVVAEWPGARSLRSLRLVAGKVGDAGAEALASSPHLGALEELSLWANRVRERGFAALAGSSQLPALRLLDLSTNRAGAGAVRAFARALALPRLEDLALGYNEARDAFPELVAAPGIRGLRRLVVSANQLSADRLRRLAFQPLPALRELWWQQNDLGGPEGAALARWPALAELDVLWAPDNRLDAEGARALAPALASARSVQLDSNRIGPKGAEAFAQVAAPRWRRLLLNGNRIGKGASALFRAPWLGQLEMLSLWGNRIDDAAVEVLAARDDLPRGLNLGKNKLTDRALIALANSPALASVAWLALGENPFTEVGLRALAASPHVDRLQRLWLGTTLDPAQLAILAPRFRSALAQPTPAPPGCCELRIAEASW